MAEIRHGDLSEDAPAGPRYSLVVPIYNDAELAEDFCREFEATFKSYLRIETIESNVELIFVNDGSAPGHFVILEKLIPDYPFVQVIDLSRNFGQHRALSCGYAHARGEFVGMLNVDQQDPPDQIPVLLARIEQDECDLVLGVRKRTGRVSLSDLGSRLFNWVLNTLTGSEGPLNVATIRIMNRRFVDAYNTFLEHSRYLPGLESWLGFRREYVETRHTPRTRGRSSYTLRSRISMAIDSIISFSDLPLRIISRLGFAIAGLGFALSFLILAQRLAGTDFLPGFVPVLSAVLIVGGVQIVVIGIASLYIGRILAEVQRRPLYVIQRKANVD